MRVILATTLILLLLLLVVACVETSEETFREQNKAEKQYQKNVSSEGTDDKQTDQNFEVVLTEEVV